MHNIVVLSPKKDWIILIKLSVCNSMILTLSNASDTLSKVSANKGPSSQGYGFPSSHVWCESCTIKKPEHWRTDAFELWCWRRLLRVPWTARRSNQSILKETSPEYSLEGLMLKLKLQYFGHLIWRTDSLEKTLMLGKSEGGRKRGW